MTAKNDEQIIVDNLDIYKLIRSNVAALENSTSLKQIFSTKSDHASSSIGTGSLELDYSMGGGVPPGRIIGIVGIEHSGKSLITTDIAKCALEAGSVVVQMDAEGTTDPLFLNARGIDYNKYRGKRDKNGNLVPGAYDRILYYQPTSGNQLGKFMHGLMSKLPDNPNPKMPPIVFILDSVLALVSDAISENVDANKMAMHARMYSEILPYLGPMFPKTGCSFVYTNQIRQKPGVSFGSNLYEPAGESLKFWSSIRIQIDKTKPKVGKLNDKEHPFLKYGTPKAGGIWYEPTMVDEEEKPVGSDSFIYSAFKTIKNKCYSPFKTCWLRINSETDGSTGYGLDPVFDTFTFLQRFNLISSAKADKKLGEKKADIDGKWELEENEYITPAELGLTSTRFSYWEFKKAVLKTRPYLLLRQRLIVSEAVFQQTDGLVSKKELEDLAKGEEENGSKD